MSTDNGVEYEQVGGIPVVLDTGHKDPATPLSDDQDYVITGKLRKTMFGEGLWDFNRGFVKHRRLFK